MTASDAVRALRALVTATQVELSEAAIARFVEDYSTTRPERLWRAVEQWVVTKQGIPKSGQLLGDDPADAWLTVVGVVNQYGSNRQHSRLPLLTNTALDVCGGYRSVARRVMRGDLDVRAEFVNAYRYVTHCETVGSTQAHDTTAEGVQEAGT